ncbi:MAG: hypothetical protein ICV66_02860 [Chitinophagaceae bacterium]|nr:hypothetical protein [Chitinophagaceae bacterium]
MKSVLPFFAVAIIFASCSTAYKTGQTPDDVYYSPERPQDEYVRVDKRDDSRYQYRDDEDYYNDRYLRMKVRNRDRWSVLDNDWYYYNPPYVFNNRYYYYNNPWNPVYYWDYYYNPYAPIIVVNPKSAVYNKPRTTNLHVFDNSPTTNPKAPNSRNRDFGTYRQPDYNTGRDVGRGLRGVFGNSSENSGSKGNSNPPSSSSDSKSSSGGSAPVRKF